MLPLVNEKRVKANIVGYNDDDDKAPKKLKPYPDATKKAFDRYMEGVILLDKSMNHLRNESLSLMVVEKLKQ